MSTGIVVNAGSLSAGQYLITANITWSGATATNNTNPIDFGLYVTSTQVDFSGNNTYSNVVGSEFTGGASYTNTSILASGGQGSLTVARLSNISSAATYYIYIGTFMANASQNTTNLTGVRAQFTIQRIFGA